MLYTTELNVFANYRQSKINGKNKMLYIIESNKKNIIFVTGKVNAVLIIITQMVLALVSIALRHF